MPLLCTFRCVFSKIALLNIIYFI